MKKILSIGIMICVATTLCAQSDSVVIYEEPAQTSDYKKRERFKYLKRSMIDERAMFKIAALPYFSGYYGSGLHLTLGYERKLTKSFSITGEFVNYINLLEPKKTFGETQIEGLWRTGLNTSIRYYYGQRKDISKGLSGNNLLSNYIELKANDVLSFSRIRNTTTDQTKSSFWVYPDLTLSWGIQRRIRKLGYFDVAIGVRYFNEKLYGNFRLTPHIKIAVGLGLSSKNKKKE